MTQTISYQSCKYACILFIWLWKGSAVLLALELKPKSTMATNTSVFGPCNVTTSLEEQYQSLQQCARKHNFNSNEFNPYILRVDGALKIANTKYPEEVHNLMEAMMSYDEPVHPIPVGASVFYFILIAWMCTFYISYFGRKLLASFKEGLNLYPDSSKFPSLPLYWLQQTKREADLRREVRNTWAWLAKRYLLSPNDPLLANVDQVLGLVNWHDFEVCRNTWSLLKLILRLNALFMKIKKNESDQEMRTYEVLRESEIPRIPMDGNKVQYVFDEDKFRKKYNIVDEVKEDEQIINNDMPQLGEFSGMESILKKRQS